ncbi:hypothetical protein NFI95_11325 [Acetobacteraceae bacterium KSS8]|uniref:Uncharacterized protein n=1 Tax=Endosaccharibacter trunci TaxID=2812733 RepID=A0ABT1W8G8_9PROT|nr:hypothetical protein [Acetobacteraceae bacterium KSS8]
MQKPALPVLAAATLLFVAPVVAARVAAAQVTTSQSALDALGSGEHESAAHHAPSHDTSHGRHAARRAATAPAPSNAPAATIPAAPPAAPVFAAPVVNVPLHPPPPPPPVPVVPNAVGAATPLPDGVRITFGANASDLNPATMQALHDFAAKLKADPQARAILDAAAAGSPDDPSTPRRLALSRGLVARAVLINDGIASTRIYVRMDPNASAGTDRVDLHEQSNPDGSVQAAASPSTTPSQAPAAGSPQP